MSGTDVRAETLQRALECADSPSGDLVHKMLARELRRLQELTTRLEHDLHKAHRLAFQMDRISRLEATRAEQQRQAAVLLHAKRCFRSIDQLCQSAHWDGLVGEKFGEIRMAVADAMVVLPP